ncbi:MAG TPA: MarC family protein [Solirubrobacteraceae bacterium]|jgi:multiple antibiotic resistance protein
MDWSVLGETFVTLVVIMDPVGVAPIFISVTQRLSAADRRRAALRATGAAAVLVIGFALVGRALFDYLDVSIESLSIAGGLLLMLVALEMLRGFDEPSGDDVDVALVPLATPLVAGPGAIATVIILNEQNPSTTGRVSVIAGIVAALLVVLAVLLAAERLGRILPASLISFLTRVFGLLLSAIAVQLVVDGVRGLV